jgi:hypothetical protein
MVPRLLHVFISASVRHTSKHAPYIPSGCTEHAHGTRWTTANAMQLADGTFSNTIGISVIGATMASSGMDATLDGSGADLTALAQQGEETRAPRGGIPPPEEDKSRGGLSGGALAGIAIAAVVVLALLVAAAVLVARARARHVHNSNDGAPGSASGGSVARVVPQVRSYCCPSTACT